MSSFARIRCIQNWIHLGWLGFEPSLASGGNATVCKFKHTVLLSTRWQLEGGRQDVYVCFAADEGTVIFYLASA